MDINDISGAIVDASIKVHKALGPGLLESAYVKHELIQRRLHVESQVYLPLHYDGLDLDAGYRIDLFVEQTVIVELKAVETITNLHKAQLLPYLKLADCRLGLLLNFNTTRMRDGIHRFANNL